MVAGSVPLLLFGMEKGEKWQWDGRSVYKKKKQPAFHEEGTSFPLAAATQGVPWH